MGREKKRSMKTRGHGKARPRAVVLVSGGMDSCVTASIAAQTHDVYALHASYGQRTEKMEKKAFRKVVRRIGAVATLEVNLRVLAEIGASSLLDRSMAVPTGKPKRGEIPSTYVPFRNGVLLAVAVAWAESVGAEKIFIGAVKVDTPEGYPDTSRKFFDAFEKTAMIGTKPRTKIFIVTPLVNMTKTEVVNKGIKIKAPLELTWSCYQGENVACGVCLSCKGRIKAFREAGAEDAVKYKTGKGKKAS